ncbi:MAG: DinB family protein [Planctomycetota bacterium]|jgi:hypothetical protein
MKYDVDQSIALLRRTPNVLKNLLGGLDECWTHESYGPDTFSVFDVMGHLIEGELKDWIPRARLLLEHGETKPFEPFDRYAMFESSRGKSMPELLNAFASLRAANVEALAGMNLSPEALAATGMHPALGRVTLSELLSMWVVHDLNHIAQICKAMAYQYADEVGPWRRYASILKPPAPAD